MTCNACGIRNGDICLLVQRQIPDLKGPACQWAKHIDNIRTCDKCGRAFENIIIDTSTSPVTFICEECLMMGR